MAGDDKYPCGVLGEPLEGTGEVRPDLDPALVDPALVDPVALAREAGFSPDERQAEVLRAMADPGVKQGILNCTRQWGKSTTAAAGAVFRVATWPGRLVVGNYYRPIKTQISRRIDNEVLDWLKSKSDSRNGVPDCGKQGALVFRLWL